MEFNKDLIAASSTPIVLAVLSEEDSYGYAIIKRVQKLSGGHMEWTDGMLYPVLHRLERLGYIKARWEEAESGRRRKYYRITSQGKAQLAEERKQWQAVDATMRGIWKSISLSFESIYQGLTAILMQGVVAVPCFRTHLILSPCNSCCSRWNSVKLHREPQRVKNEFHRERSN